MLSKLKSDYLIKNGVLEERYIVGKDAYEELTPEEKKYAKEYLNGQYIVEIPQKVSSEEVSEIVQIRMAEDISDIKRYAKIICGIMVVSLVLGLIAGLYSVISIVSVL